MIPNTYSFLNSGVSYTLNLLFYFNLKTPLLVGTVTPILQTRKQSHRDQVTWSAALELEAKPRSLRLQSCCFSPCALWTHFLTLIFSTFNSFVLQLPWLLLLLSQKVLAHQTEHRPGVCSLVRKPRGIVVTGQDSGSRAPGFQRCYFLAAPSYTTYSLCELLPGLL